MTQDMTRWGIGPKLAMATILYSILIEYVTSSFPQIFDFPFIPRFMTTIIGLIILIIGVLFFISSISTFSREYKKGKLITTGTYSLCRNPIYSSFIVFIIPSIALLLHAWLLITASIFMYVMFKANIGKENEYLRDRYGDEYRGYERRVNEILPIPKTNRTKGM
ncbi:MAG TPA: isoprenylcysteine carboxylmethyltransferase family protein [Spirochaetia bacterium]|nr:isoprenylcysteine carboxylmethyltransferase family protein [Spirochaetia bacterium]